MEPSRKHRPDLERAAAFTRDMNAYEMAVGTEQMVRALRRVADEIEAGTVVPTRVSVRQVAETTEVALFELQLEARVKSWE